MPEHLTPVNVAIAFAEAWTSHDMTTAASYVGEDVVFEGPMSPPQEPRRSSTA